MAGPISRVRGCPFLKSGYPLLATLGNSWWSPGTPRRAIQGVETKRSHRWPVAAHGGAYPFALKRPATQEPVEEAEQHHRQAVHVLDGVGLPLRRAQALLHYGRFLRHNGQPVLAREPLSEAIQESKACGEARLAAQARTELRASGGRRSWQSSRQLSSQEQSVTALASEGTTNEEMANQLFISVKTVGRHLTSACGKLGIRSRKELQKHLKAP